jgi:hypothetical protein
MIKAKPTPGASLTRPFLIQVSPSQDAAIEAERRIRGLKSRTATIRALVDEALHRAAIRRKAGKPVEIGKDEGR